MSDNTTILLAILGGGGLGAVASFITSRAVARKTNVEANVLEAKLPAEVDSVNVQGAETAVLTMKAALESATGRIVQLEAERGADRARIQSLEERVENLQRQVAEAEAAAGEARREGAAIRQELSAFRVEQEGRL